jgi:hypothetical protein
MARKARADPASYLGEDRAGKISPDVSTVARGGSIISIRQRCTAASRFRQQSLATIPFARNSLSDAISKGCAKNVEVERTFDNFEQ